MKVSLQKVLSNRLKMLQGAGIVKKVIVTMTPVVIGYQITNKAELVNRLLYEIAVFASLLKPGLVFRNENISVKEAVEIIGSTCSMPEELIAVDSEIR